MTIGRIIDVSSQNHGPSSSVPINWAAVAKDGVTAAFIKATQGTTYTNPWYLRDLRGAQAAGILTCAYHFAGSGNPITEAEYFLSVAGAVKARMLDFETRTDAQWARTFLLTLGRPRSELITYGSASSLKDFYAQLPSMAFPAAYQKLSPGWGACWQFTDAATVSGIPGVCDEDRWLGDETQYSTLFGVFDPPTEEEPVLIAYTPSGNGYWLISMTTGAVDAFGDAQYFGGVNDAGPNGSSALVPGDTITGFASHPGGEGYIATTRGMRIYAFGAAKDLGTFVQ